MTAKDTEQQGMLLAEWRANQLHNVVLPSGLAAVLKRVGIKELAAQGRVPETLLQLMSSKADQKDGKLKIDLSDLSAVAEAYSVIAMACLVEPPVGLEATDDVLSIEELPFEDKEWLFSWSNEEATDLSNFPDEE